VRKFRIKINGEVYEVEVEEIGGPLHTPGPVSVYMPPQAPEAAPLAQAPASVPVAAAPNAVSFALGDAGVVTSPMPGVINDIKVEAGDEVKPGDVLVILEAMKMENQIKADIAGIVKEIRVTKGQAVNSGDPLVVIS